MTQFVQFYFANTYFCKGIFANEILRVVPCKLVSLKSQKILGKICKDLRFVGQFYKLKTPHLDDNVP